MWRLRVRMILPARFSRVLCAEWRANHQLTTSDVHVTVYFWHLQITRLYNCRVMLLIRRTERVLVGVCTTSNAAWFKVSKPAREEQGLMLGSHVACQVMHDWKNSRFKQKRKYNNILLNLLICFIICWNEEDSKIVQHKLKILMVFQTILKVNYFMNIMIKNQKNKINKISINSFI